MKGISKENNHGRNHNNFKLLTALIVHNNYYEYYKIVEVAVTFQNTLSLSCSFITRCEKIHSHLSSDPWP